MNLGVSVVLLISVLFQLSYSQSPLYSNFYSKVRTGKLTFYGAGSDSGGTCMYNNPRSSISNTLPTVAIGDWQTANKCGMCVYITPLGTGSGNSDFKTRKPFYAYVNNQCPECGTDNLDLAETSDGIWDINWQAVDCPNVGDIKLQLKTGSSIWHTEIQARDYINALSALELQFNGVWTSIPRKDYNFFVTDTQVTLPLNIRLTSVTGKQVTTSISAYNLEPAVISTGVQFPASTTTPTTAPTAVPTVVPTAPVKPPTAPTAPVKPPTAPTAPVKPPTAPTAPVKPPTAPTAPVKPPTAPTAPLTCSYAHNDIHWIEVNVQSVPAGATVKVACKNRMINCIANWGKYQCDPSPSTCEGPRGVVVNTNCCALETDGCASVSKLIDDENASHSGPLSTGELAGIVVGVVVFVILVIVAIAVYLGKRSTVEVH